MNSKENTVRHRRSDDRLCTSNAALAAFLFQNEVILLLRLFSCYANLLQTLLSSQPPLSGLHMLVP